MASLQPDDAVRYLTRPWAGRTALLALALAAACGGDRNRAVSMDTTGAAQQADSAAAPKADTAAPDTTPTPAATAPGKPAPTEVAARPAKTRDSVAKPAPAPRPKATPAPGADTAGKAQPTQTAAAPSGQDTSKASADKPAAQTADAPLRDAYHQAPRDTVSAAVYDGWKQFNLNCARCHGEDVSGTTIAPHLIVSLKPTGPINTKELFVQTVCAGRPAKGMPAWCALGLGMDKINDIYEYVKGRSDAKISPGRPAVKQEG